jgi:hypothetical protein
MSELLKTRCKTGYLIITDTQIKTTGLRIQVMDRSTLTGVDYQKTVPSLFGMGGSGNFIFHGQGTQQLCADMVVHKDAKRILQLLGYGE